MGDALLAATILLGLAGGATAGASRLSPQPTVKRAGNGCFSSTSRGSTAERGPPSSILHAGTREIDAHRSSDGPTFGDLDYTGEFLIESGNEDRYAGFVFHLRDAGDYYAVRFSASENNVFFARFDRGAMHGPQGFNATVSNRQWHKVKLVVRKDVVTIFLDGRRIGTASDPAWRVGGVGVGTKSDSVTRFRNLSIKAV